MTRRRTGRRRNEPQPRRPERAPGDTADPAGADLMGNLDAEWIRRRAGARNVAGVRYQIAVAAYALVAGRCGIAPIRSVVPEGFDDIDCRTADGTTLLLQVKERAAGAAAIGAAEAIAVFARSAVVTRDVVPGLVTDAELTGGIKATDWGGTLESVLDADQLKELVRRLPPNVPSRFVTGARVLRLPWHISLETTALVATEFSIPPAVAAIAVAVLLEELSEVSADQRTRDVGDPLERRLADVDRIVHTVLELTDLTALEAPLRLGHLELADFTRPAADTQERFLRGVDVEPHHIAAGYDLPRPLALEAIHSGLATSRVALVVGPSGSGKSALIWRAALDLPGGARTYRVRRLTDETAPDLVRFIKIQRPTEWSPVLVCVDDLGRPTTAAWPSAAHQLLEIPHVLLLGGARQEDFEPGQALGRAVVVEPTLDATLAFAVDKTLADRGVERRLDPKEAYDHSSGLLMEYVALLIGGERLEATVALQVRERLAPERNTELELMRYVCLGHVLGAAVDAAALPVLLRDRPELPTALDRLRDEHVITSPDGRAWVGLHELRSEAIVSAAHRSPPPREATTAAALVASTAAPVCAHLLVQAVRRYDADAEVVAAYRSRLEAATDSGDAAALIRGALIAEATLWARDALLAARAVRIAVLDDFSKVSLAYGLSRTSGTSLPLDPQILRFAEKFPRPPRALRTEIVGDALSRDLAVLLSGATGEELAESLENLVGATRIETGDAATLWRDHESDPLSTRARIARALADLAPNSGAALGALEGRVGAVRAGVPHVVDGPAFDAATLAATATVLVFDQEDVNGQMVDLCRTLLSLIPEATTVEVFGVDADGEPYAPGGYEVAHKRLTPDKLPAAGRIAAGVAMLDAARKEEALSSWTHRLRLQAPLARELTAVLEETVEFLLNPYFYEKRKREWRKRLEALAAGAARLPPPPLEELDRTTRDPAQKGLDLAAGTLRRLSELRSSDAGAYRGIAVMLRKALLELESARQANYPTLATVADPLPERLLERLELVADLLLFLADGRPSPRYSSATWIDRAAEQIAEAKSEARTKEIQWLRQAAGEYDHEVFRTERTTDDPWLSTDELLVLFPTHQAAALDATPTKITGAARESLRFRTHFALQHDGAVVPGLGIRLGAEVDYPLSGDRLEELALHAGLEFAVSPSHAATIGMLDRLALASRWASLARLRGESAPVEHDEAASIVSEVVAGVAALPPVTGEMVRDLAEIVADELGGSDYSIAAETARYVRTMQLNDMVRFLAAAAVSALQDDIQNGRLSAPKPREATTPRVTSG